MDDDGLSETTRLTHRVLDLRRPQMQRNMMLRYRVAMEVRKFLDAERLHRHRDADADQEHAEGRARLPVPSRVHDGEFFALPQSPQLFKQLLMVAGFDRYYQIVVLPRRGPARRPPARVHADRHRDLVSEEEIRSMFEGMIRSTFEHAIGVKPPAFPVMLVRRRDAPLRPTSPTCASSSSSSSLTDAVKPTSTSRCSTPATIAAGRRRRAAHPGRARRSVAARSTLHRVRPHLRRQGPGMDQGQRLARGARACSPRS